MADLPLLTERLILRAWRDEDAPPFQAICTDPAVMEFLGPPLTLASAQELVRRQQGWQANLGYCFWAMEHRATGELMGFCGIKPGAQGTPIEGRIEIGWRMARKWWGAGLACEAARATLDWTWAHLDTDSVWAITTTGNLRSRALMRRLGMIRRHDLDFDHPALPDGDPLRAHMTCRIERPGPAPTS